MESTFTAPTEFPPEGAAALPLPSEAPFHSARSLSLPSSHTPKGFPTWCLSAEAGRGWWLLLPKPCALHSCAVGQMQGLWREVHREGLAHY